MLKGIDISEHQGKTFRIADHSPEFVIIRGGFSETVDRCAYEFVEQAEQLDIPWGVYWYSYALTIKEAAVEAGACLKFLNGRKPPLGVWFDMEDCDGYKKKNGFPSNDTITLMCREFCGCMKDRGLFTGIYAALSWFGTHIKDTNFPRWIAAWGANDGVHYPDLRHSGDSLGGQCVMHQYRGAPLDLDLLFDLDLFKIEESNKEPEKMTVDIEKIALEVIDGKWSNGLDRKEKLGAWFYSLVQHRVNKICEKEMCKNGTI